MRLNHLEVDQLTRFLGRAPSIAGLSREELAVLAALGRRPVTRLVPSGSALPAHLLAHLSHLFWDVPHPTAVALRENRSTPACHLLTSDDSQAFASTASALVQSDLLGRARFRGVDGKTHAVLENMAL